MPQPKSRLKRPKHRMPTDVRKALVAEGLLDRYRAGPDYQRNDYIGWTHIFLAGAVRNETRTKRLNQMLQEPAAGDRYTKIAFKSKP